MYKLARNVKEYFCDFFLILYTKKYLFYFRRKFDFYVELYLSYKFHKVIKQIR
jgi:hypothetical protein